VADVSAVADPNTGVSIYDIANNDGGWNVYGGTSTCTRIPFGRPLQYHCASSPTQGAGVATIIRTQGLADGALDAAKVSP
jgi:hypothetical protein